MGGERTNGRSDGDLDTPTEPGAPTDVEDDATEQQETEAASGGDRSSGTG